MASCELYNANIVRCPNRLVYSCTLCCSVSDKEMEVNAGLDHSGAYINHALNASTVSIQTSSALRGSDEFICEYNINYNQIN